MIGLGRIIRRYTFLASRAGGILIGLAVWSYLSTRETVSVPWRDAPYEMDTFSAALAAFVAYLIASRVIGMVLARTVQRIGDGNQTRRD